MKVVITGGSGFLGLRLTEALLERGLLVGRSGTPDEVEEVVLFDVGEAPAGLDPLVSSIAGDIADRRQVDALIDRADTSVFHLASVVSAGAEQDFDLAMRVNLEGGLNVLEACRARAPGARLVFASSMAAYGGAALPELVTDLTKLTPGSTYGTTKAILELLVNDYTRKGFIDGRGARLPTVIIRPGKPNLAASSWCSSIFREPLAGTPYALPVPLETRTIVAGVTKAIEGLIVLHDAEAAELGDDRTLSFPSLSVTASEMVEALEPYGTERALGEITVEPDPSVEAIVSGWPQRMSAERAEALGIPGDDGLDSIVRAYLAREG